MSAPSPNATPLPNVFRLGGWRVLRDQNRLERVGGEGTQVERIEPKAMDVLCMLAANAGQTVTREALLGEVWAGRLVVEAALKDVDICPLIPLIENAGGVITTWDGGPAEQGGNCVAAATPELHAAAMAVLRG